MFPSLDQTLSPTSEMLLTAAVKLEFFVQYAAIFFVSASPFQPH